MSTGFQINSAKDDAAGMYVATKMTTQIRGLLQARQNTNDGISYLSTASESLGGMTDLLNRIRDLAVQGANGVYDETARGAMQAEADELTRELYRLKNSTVFNGKAIFGKHIRLNRLIRHQRRVTFAFKSEQTQTVLQRFM